MNTIPERLVQLRDRMRALGLTHYIVPSADEHINEYLPDWGLRRQWASGFTGSAGDLLVSQKEDETLLFTDGRYHLQAEQELSGSTIGVQKVGVKGVKTLGQFLRQLAEDQGAACVVGYDPMVLPIETADALKKSVTEQDGVWQPITPNLVDELWQDRPQPAETPLISTSIELTGVSMKDKVERLREDLRSAGADAFVAVRLDQIAWLTNLRSMDDVPYNPVFEAYLYVDFESVRLFLRAPDRRLPENFGADLEGFIASPYEEFLPFLESLREQRLLLDPGHTTAGVLFAVHDNEGLTVIRRGSPVESAKALKNETELECMKRANLMSSVAKTRALIWLEDELAAGRKVTERSFLEQIEGYYAEIDGYRGLSFSTISSTGEHGAIIHYGAADQTELEPGHLFLIDSGIQMDGGTTDCTRTVPVGEPSLEQRRLYTLVLKGHVRAANQVFPAGTPGTAIDAVTRSALWSEQLNYDHGTGHGVGAFLCVHEGPFAISERRRKPFAEHGLEAGMVTSIEPGWYGAGVGGIRIENLYYVEPTGRDSDNGVTWLRFNSLTWVPMDRRLIDENLLDEAEKLWLRRYHEECLTHLEPHLSTREMERLRDWSR